MNMQQLKQKHDKKIYIALLYVLSGMLSPILFATQASAATAGRTRVCSTKQESSRVSCFAEARTREASAVPMAEQAFGGGLGPADYKAAYGIGDGADHVAVVVAYDAPNAKKDLDTYSVKFGLPLLPDCAAGQQTGCFVKLDQNGGKNYPRADAGWSLEASMDVQTVHAACPKCRITLVEAIAPTFSSLTTAVDQAVTQGAKIVSNSYGGSETSIQKIYDPHFKRPGVVMTVSSGDSGYGTSWPAASPDVIAVGGTSLHMSDGKVVSETAWSDAGSGCSRYEPKPVWQHDTSCARRSIADVSAVADPDTGAAIYDSYAVSGQSGWFVMGGTSLSAPLVAGLLASNKRTDAQPASLYANLSTLRDITSGRNGRCRTYLCNSVPGYDGPTGLGVLKF